MDRNSETERQGHNHRDWDKRQEQVQRLRDTNRDRVIGTGRHKWGQSHTNVNYECTMHTSLRCSTVIELACWELGLATMGSVTHNLSQPVKLRTDLDNLADRIEREQNGTPP